MLLSSIFTKNVVVQSSILEVETSVVNELNGVSGWLPCQCNSEVKWVEIFGLINIKVALCFPY